MKKRRYSYEEKTEFIEYIAMRHTSWECLIWPFNLTDAGYPVYEPHVQGHRYVCELQNGPPPGPFYDAAHSCGLRACVNRLHVRWTTKVVNAADRITHDTHNRGERAAAAKLTNAQASEIRRRPETHAALAREYGVSPAAIWHVRHGKTFKDAA